MCNSYCIIVTHYWNKMLYNKQNVLSVKFNGFVDYFAHTQNPSNVYLCKLVSLLC